ncbi:uncharacterized protein phf11 isoform X2 [Lampris incognitus]|uniref:uncharacterized protein phf11 isoform X2 n=1 Tax=Lampris incognitus TaxID=2546036 RepID=UPI0024B4C1D6|nr:uncharacterized protein phf11 isoform X2 [Lampris incognitus]
MWTRLYCRKHRPGRDETSDVNSRSNSSMGEPEASVNHNEAESHKVVCRVCDKKEESISLENFNSDIVNLYCDVHKPSSHPEAVNEHEAVAGPSSDRGESHTPKRYNHLKRHSSSTDKYVCTPKRKLKRRILDDPSDSGDETDVGIFALLESDIDSNRKSDPADRALEPQSVRADAEKPAASPPGNPPVHRSRNGKRGEEGETILYSALEPQSVRADAEKPAASPPGNPPVHRSRNGKRGEEGETILYSALEPQSVRADAEKPAASPPGNPPVHRSRNGKRGEEGETILYSDPESESLLRPQTICISPGSKTTGADLPQSPGSMRSPDPNPAGPSGGQENSAGPANLPPPSASCSKYCTSTPVTPGKHENSNNTPSPLPPVHPSTSPTLTPPSALTTTLLPCTSFPLPHHSAWASDPLISSDAVAFWKSCNQAACTQAIFSDFINDMNDISCRIQSDRASQEDYVTALRVMEASGKLSELVAKQEEELKQKQAELQMAVAAMEKARSVLRRDTGQDSRL